MYKKVPLTEWLFQFEEKIPKIYPTTFFLVLCFLDCPVMNFITGSMNELELKCMFKKSMFDCKMRVECYTTHNSKTIHKVQ